MAEYGKAQSDMIKKRIKRKSGMVNSRATAKKYFKGGIV